MLKIVHRTFRLPLRTDAELTGLMAAEGFTRSAMIRLLIRRAFQATNKPTNQKPKKRKTNGRKPETGYRVARD